MFKLLLSIFSRHESRLVLGRWGYHWEQKMKYNSYYD